MCPSRSPWMGGVGLPGRAAPFGRRENKRAASGRGDDGAVGCLTDRGAALRLTKIAGRHEPQLGTNMRDEFNPGVSGRGDEGKSEGGPDALSEEDDGAGMRLVVVAAVVNVFVRLRRRDEHRECEHQGGGQRRDEAAAGSGKGGVGKHG